MKIFVVMGILLLCFSLSALAQSTPLVITAEDVQLQFVADPTDQWRAVENFAIAYFTPPDEPPGGTVIEHNPKGKLGIQEWQCGLQKEEVQLDWCVITFNLTSVPSPLFRSYIIRVRPRDDVLIGEWEISKLVKIIGRTTIPVYVGTR